MAKDSKDYQKGTVEYERGLLLDSILRIAEEQHQESKENYQEPFWGKESSPRSKGRRSRN